MSAYTYDHNTAHILEPIQGYDLVSFMNFWAPLDPSVEDAVPGTVMSRNESGKLIRGLDDESMAQFLYSKQDTEDVVNNPVTANSLEVTSISLNSFGDFRNGIIPPYHVDGWTSGASSNMGQTTWTDAGVAKPVEFRAQTSVYTTFPGACGLELASSEFALFKDDGTTRVDYAYDTPLTSPKAAGNAYSAAGNAGTVDQNKIGGFLKPGKHYVNNICGIVSRQPFRNENGTWILCFWACHKPAMTAATKTALNLTAADKLAGYDIDTTGAATGKILKLATSGDTLKWTIATDATE